MVDLKDLRENPDKYRRGAELKNVKADIDQILRLDEQHRAAQREFEKARAEQNEASKEIGKLKDASQKQAAIARVSELKTTVKTAEEQAKAAEAALMPLLLQVPQPPDSDVPPGKDAADNVVLYRWGQPRKFDFAPKSHIELAEELDLVDFGAGARIAGSRSYFLKGVGAELHSAMLRLALDMMIYENGFVPMTVPVLVREAAMRGTGFFPAGREQAYRVGEPEETGDEIRFLTGTAEVGLTAYEMPEKDDVSINEADLPLKYVSVSTCFRREAGTYGKDTAGLYRVHQFDKCEQVVICKNDVEESKQWHLKMLGFAEEILKRLNLPYRVIQCCTGDIGVKNAAMMDIETWMPSRQSGKDPDSGYGETHSASRLYEFQARRLNLRYRAADGKLRFCHTLNNTVVASPRILIPILENYQNADGTVTIPEALRKYLNGREKIEKAERKK
ncbi:MAG TPA: serine--tRNA ligase [Humisphaera sp.]|jgi:seryl-tRNA synthetase|nr:serine--tRNA ligase [Humisphaera sp.]